MRLENKTALITGASRNIGAEIARTFAREGADLILNTRQSAQELESVAAQCRELGVRTHTVIGDVSDPDRVAAMVSEGIDALGTVDVLVSNVAVRPHKPLLDVSVEEWQDVIATNLHASFYPDARRVARDARAEFRQHHRAGRTGGHHRPAGNRRGDHRQTGLLGLIRSSCRRVCRTGRASQLSIRRYGYLP